MENDTTFFEVNGVKVACIPNQSEMVFFGIMALAGSNYETPAIAGISHFAEHLFFKGTEDRNWRQINQEFAKMGACNNAYTSNTEVFYHATCPKFSLPRATNLMIDMIFNSTFPEDEMEKERTVIAEEKKMYQDDHGAFFESAIDENFLKWEKGHHIIGTFDSIASISKQEVVEFLNTRYSLNNMLLVCCGNVDPEELKHLLHSDFAELVDPNHPYLSKTPRHKVSTDLWTDEVANNTDPIKLVVEREILQQSQVKMLVQDVPVYDPDRSAATVLLKAIGGGMYSLLFSRIREELGLCYHVSAYSAPVAYPDYMMASINGSLATENVDLFMEETEKIIQDVMKNGISEDLFECAKTTSLVQVLRATETSVGKGNFLAPRYLFDRKDGVTEIIDRYHKVTIEDCNAVASRIFDVNHNWAVMNPKV